MITRDDAITALRAVVAGNEDFTYEPPDGKNCVYVQDGKPSCVVGKALFHLGVPIEELAALDTAARGDSGEPSSVHARALDAHMDIEPGTSAILGQAQSCQDNGRFWGYALDRAEEEYHRLNRV